MGQRRGTLLERDVSRLFKTAGFEPKNNVFIEGYEIDIFVQIESHSVIIECKQYEKSSLVIRNLVHQWESKNRIIKASKILLVLVGCNISQKDFELAERFGIFIWDEKLLDYLTDLSIKDKNKAKSEIFKSLDINPIKPKLDEIMRRIDHLRYKLTSETGRITSENASQEIQTRLEDCIEEITHIARIIKKLNVPKETKESIIKPIKKNMFGIPSILYNSIYYSIKMSIENSINSGKVTLPKKQLKEVK